MESDTVEASISVRRKGVANKHTWDDILYLLMGDSSPANALILILTIILFGTAPVLLILFFANYSGGMRWLLTLAIVTVLGVMAVYLMKRGVRRESSTGDGRNTRTEFTGQLTGLTAAVDRGAAGYVYSQQMLRERLCQDIINKLALARDISADEIIAMLDDGNTGFISDRILAEYLIKNRRGSRGWEESTGRKGKSAERGRRFMMETEIILDRIEEIV